MTIHVLPLRAPNPYSGPEVSTVAKSGKYRELSPFLLGPVDTYLEGVQAQNLENLWQYSKVYPHQVGSDGYPSTSWFIWRTQGWRAERAVRYPMGRGAIPSYSWWDGQKLGYIEARKKIYTPIYAKYVILTKAYQQLKELYLPTKEITLLSYDAYDHIKMGMTLRDVINNPKRKMGHAFVLAMLLEGCLEECLV